MKATTRMEEPATAQLQRVIAIHFDPEGGAPYWLAREAQLGIDARRSIRRIEDLAVFGPMDADALATRPVEDFLPRSRLARRPEFLLAETGGTLGRPKFAVHRADEFHAAFVEPFVIAAARAGFPREENWLFAGPTGPHIIGRAAGACARALGSPDPFRVDFDPRWAKALAEGSFARERYLRHIAAQALNVIETQRVGVIFSTPPVLRRLGEAMPALKRAAVKGIHLGGLSVAHDFRAWLAATFPAAVVLSGYGNTLFGMCPELAFDPQAGIDYYPWGVRSVFALVEPAAGGEAVAPDRVVPYGERGQVCVHRLDETQFIPNMIERDAAVRIPPRADAAASGFLQDGLRDPRPLVQETARPAIGLY